jgi:hypothetical protein
LEWRQYQCCRLDGLPHQIEAIPFQPIQSFPNLRRVSLAVRRKTDPISHALEQRNTQKRLQSTDLTADGTLGQR